MKENNMKPRRTQRHTGPNWPGKGLSVGDKAALSQAKPTLLVTSPVQVKPFAGKVFYLDLPSNRIAETLERDIKELGGTVEKFFSKEIKYLVSNKREARYVHCLRQDSPVPSPDSGQSSPHPRLKPQQPGSHGDTIKIRSQGQTDTFVTSRGKSLVERVVKEQERVQMNKILSNALDWGVKILYIDDIMAYVQKKKKIAGGQCPATAAVKSSVKVEPAAKQGFQKCKGRITKPFVKVEDSSRYVVADNRKKTHYRPIYITMPNMPEFNLKTAPPGTPFCVEDRDPPGNKQRGHSEERVHGRKKTRDKKRGGYCECCMVKYENVTMHLQSERHKAFSKSDEYLVVDKLVSTLHCSFIHIRTQVKRPKCSAASVLIAPGPCGKTELRHKGLLNTTEIIKEEQHRTVTGHEGSYSGHTLKTGSAPASTSLIHREGDRKAYCNHSDRSKHKSLARKRPSRQNSSTSCTQKAPQPKVETAPSRGEGVASSPSRVTQLDLDKDMNSSASYFNKMNTQSEVSSKSFNVMTKQQESLQDGNSLPEKAAGNILSEKEEGRPPTQSSSPVCKVQRRIRVYKRKRRKLDTCSKHGKQTEDIPDGSILKLWELFQSSDNMDVEFLGFDNYEGNNEPKG